MTDNLQMDVLSSLLKYSEDIRERGELDLLTAELFTHELFSEIYTGLHSHGFIPSGYIDSITDTEFRQYVNSLKSRGMYNKSFPEIVGALREKSAKDRVSTEMQSLLLSGDYSADKAMQIINDYGCSSNYTPLCAANIEPKPIEWVMQNFIPRGMLSSGYCFQSP